MSVCLNLMPKVFFSSGGRQPKMKKVEGSDPKDGRTIYVGARDSEKFIRCYEKGFEILARYKIPENLKAGITGMTFDGVGMVDPAKVYRCEVEFKASSEKVLPWPMLTNRDEFFAGANPFCVAFAGCKGAKNSNDAGFRAKGGASSCCRKSSRFLRRCAESADGVVQQRRRFGHENVDG